MFTHNHTFQGIAKSGNIYPNLTLELALLLYRPNKAAALEVFT